MASRPAALGQLRPDSGVRRRLQGRTRPDHRHQVAVPLVDQLLAVAFIASLVAFTLDHALGKGLQDITILVPFGAVLAARQFASVAFGDQDQVLRYQRVGKTWMGAASGPRLQTLMRIRTSSGACLAYSTNTSQ